MTERADVKLLDETSLTEAQKNAVAWHAEQSVVAALEAGAITDEEMEAHWIDAERFLLRHPDLLKKIVSGYRHHLKGEPVDSCKIVFSYCQKHPEAEREHQAVRRGARNRPFAAGAAVALCLTSQWSGVPFPPVQGNSPIPIRIGASHIPHQSDSPIEQPLSEQWVERLEKLRERRGRREVA